MKTETHNGKLVQPIEISDHQFDACERCCFQHGDECPLCFAAFREDGKEVYFVEVSND